MRRRVQRRGVKTSRLTTQSASFVGHESTAAPYHGRQLAAGPVETGACSLGGEPETTSYLAGWQSTLNREHQRLPLPRWQLADQVAKTCLDLSTLDGQGGRLLRIGERGGVLQRPGEHCPVLGRAAPPVIAQDVDRDTTQPSPGRALSAKRRPALHRPEKRFLRQILRQADIMHRVQKVPRQAKPLSGNQGIEIQPHTSRGSCDRRHRQMPAFDTWPDSS